MPLSCAVNCNHPCLFVRLFVGTPYYNQRAVFASPLSTFSFRYFTAISALCYGKCHSLVYTAIVYLVMTLAKQRHSMLTTHILILGDGNYRKWPKTKADSWSAQLNMRALRINTRHHWSVIGCRPPSVQLHTGYPYTHGRRVLSIWKG